MDQYSLCKTVTANRRSGQYYHQIKINSRNCARVESNSTLTEDNAFIRGKGRIRKHPLYDKFGYRFWVFKVLWIRDLGEIRKLTLHILENSANILGKDKFTNTLHNSKATASVLGQREIRGGCHPKVNNRERDRYEARWLIFTELTSLIWPRTIPFHTYQGTRKNVQRHDTHNSRLDFDLNYNKMVIQNNSHHEFHTRGDKSTQRIDFFGNCWLQSEQDVTDYDHESCPKSTNLTWKLLQNWTGRGVIFTHDCDSRKRAKLGQNCNNSKSTNTYRRSHKSTYQHIISRTHTDPA